MDESTTQLHSEGAVAEPQNQAAGIEVEGGGGGGGSEDEKNENEEEAEEEELVAKAQGLMDKITASPDNPNPSLLHSLASLLESQESRYVKEHDHSSNNNARASHTIGRLGNLVRDNDEFFELVSSRCLSEVRFSTSVQAASARLLMSCSPTWMYPHVFEDAVLENIKIWVMDDTARSLCEEGSDLKHDLRGRVSDHEMLKTYSTGLLAMSLVGSGPLVEDALTCGLSAKLMRYLRVLVLGDTSQRDSSSINLVESKNASTATPKGREESRVRVRQLVVQAQFDDSTDGRYVDDFEKNQDRMVGIHACREDSKIDSVEPPHVFCEGLSTETGPDGDDKLYSRDSESSRGRMNRLAKSKSKGRQSEGVVELEGEHGFNSPGFGGRLGQMRINKDKSLSRYPDVKKVSDATKLSNHISSDGLESETDDSLFYIEEFRVGNRDISEIVKQAVRAAEAEARAANAPAGAIKAAAAAAAEVVKTAALEEFRNSNDEEAAVLAASKAASTVIDAANVVEISRSSITIADAKDQVIAYAGPIDDAFEYFIPDTESLAQLREKYCIQCLEILGEYVEVLGPVLHENGVDVCLALLQNSSSASKETSTLLPEVMKLICALAAHRKFASLFVDRGGMQQLLAIPRVSQTFFGLSSCLFTIGSIQGIMERVCALPLDVVTKVVELAIQLLECPQDQARKNAALFFAAAFVFRAVLDAFDARDGLQKFLGVLNDVASVRFGVGSSTLSSLSNSGSLRHDRLLAEVLTSSEKQIAYHTCVALRQYFRAQLLLIVDSIRPTKSNRSAPRNISSMRAAYKPLDISNEAIDAVFLQLQKDRKLGPAFVRTRWPAVDKFLASNGHLTLLELCQAPPVERYLHDLIQYALGVLHIITLVPHSRKMIVNATLSNDRLGSAIILDAANIASSYVDPEIIQPALHVLINLVCPPPSISNKPSVTSQGQQSVSAQASGSIGMDSRGERNVDRTNISDRPFLANLGESSGADRGALAAPTNSSSLSSQAAAATSGLLVGDRRISLGAGAGCAGLAAQLEQGYRLAREAVRANNGIKVLLHLLQPRVYSSPLALDCLRALACRVLLGLARDDTIAHILTKLQVGKKLSELIRDTGSQSVGGEQARWQAELAQAVIELIAIVTNSGRASTLAATDAAIPTLRRIERAAIATATPITYHSRELLLLIHEHLQASGLLGSASMLLKEAQLTPLPTLAGPQSLPHLQTSCTTHDSFSMILPLQWPCARTAGGGFLSEKWKRFGGLLNNNEEESSMTTFSSSSKKKPPPALLSPSPRTRNQPQPNNNDLSSSSKKVATTPISTKKQLCTPTAVCDTTPSIYKTRPIILPVKRKHFELKDTTTGSCIISGKRMIQCSSSSEQQQGLRSPICLTPHTNRKTSTSLVNDACGPSSSTPSSSHVVKDMMMMYGRSITDTFGGDRGGQSSSSLEQHGGGGGHLNEIQQQPGGTTTTITTTSSSMERLTLDSVVVQYLKHQHRQCPAPITTLPPLSLLHPHVCPEPKRSLDAAPSNVTARLGTREYRSMYGGVHENRRDRQFVFSRFRPWRTCRDNAGGLFTCIAFAGDSSHVAVGSHTGEIKIFDTNNNNVLESFTSHQAPLTLVQSSYNPLSSSGSSNTTQQLLLSSSTQDVRLWDASSISSGPLHPFEGCKTARFSNSGTHFAALSTTETSSSSRREILLFDIQTNQMELKLSVDSVTGRGHVYSLAHFSPSDAMVLWNGVLWDCRVSGPVHRFDQFTDYGGGGFHPAGNEVIINSEVWDLRKFRLLRSVPSLDQTAITFNARGDVIYAILRRNLEDPTSAMHTRRAKHPLFSAFRTIDAVNYSDIATVLVDRCVLDFATEPTDSFVGLMTMDDQDDMVSSGRIYEIGRRKPTDDDSDPDDAESEEEEDEDDDDDDDGVDPLLGPDLDDDDDDDSMSHGDDSSMSDLDDDDDEDADFMMDEVELDGGAGGILDILTEGDEDEDDEDQLVESFSSSDDEGNGFGF